MRIVVWNCAKKLRGEKLQALEDLRPDIAIVPDCESPQKLWGKQPLWRPSPWNGSATMTAMASACLPSTVTASSGMPTTIPSLRWILPIEVRGSVNFHLLAVWAVNQRIPQSEDEELSGQPLEAVKRYRRFLPKPLPWRRAISATIFAGTKARRLRIMRSPSRLWNGWAWPARTMWLVGNCTEKKRRARCGRRPAIGGPKDHVDYCFLPLEWCSHLREVEVGAYADWIGKGLSNHVPLVVDVDLPAPRSGIGATSAKARRTDLQG